VGKKGNRHPEEDTPVGGVILSFTHGTRRRTPGRVLDHVEEVKDRKKGTEKEKGPGAVSNTD